MPDPKPSLDLLRSMSDERVVRAVMEHGRATRADLAVLTGLSKPTVSESVRRLVEAGAVADTGERTTGRGRTGSYHSLAADVGVAIVLGVGPQGVVGELVDAFGGVRARVQEPLAATSDGDEARRVLDSVARTVGGSAGGLIRVAVVSAADPVDRATGRLVHLPDAPFLMGDVDAVAVLAPLVAGRVQVDNDVNWAARAERAIGAATGTDDFVYVHLGAGLGSAVVSDGEVRRGHAGMAGEIAHLLTSGPDGRSVHLTQVFADLGLRHPGSTAIDSRLLLARLNTEGPEGPTRSVVSAALHGVLLAAVALADPEVVLVGGDWGRHPSIAADLAAAFEAAPRGVAVAAAALDSEPEMVGARAEALSSLRSAIVDDLRAGAS